MRFARRFTAGIVPLLVAAAVFGVGRSDANAMTMSVTRINTISTDPSFGTIIENLLSEELHRQGDFVLIDRNQRERTDKRASADIADKVITGSFVQQSGLLINVLAIDSRSSTIDISLTETVGKDADLGAIVRHIAEQIHQFYSVRRFVEKGFDMTVKPAVFVPTGTYSKYLHPGAGVSAAGTANNIGNGHISLSASAGGNRFSPKTERYRSFMQVFAACGPALRFNPVNPLLVTVKAGAGPVWTRAEYDIDGRYGVNGFDYRAKWFVNPCGVFETELAVHLYERWMLALSAGYMFVYDRSRNGSLFFAGAGIKTML